MYPSGLHDDDDVTMQDRVESVCYRQNCALSKALSDRLLDHRVCRGVNGGRGLV